MIRLADVNYDMVVTANSGLNYRTGPGIQYEKLGAVPKGTPLHCTKCENGWYNILPPCHWCPGKPQTRAASLNRWI